MLFLLSASLVSYELLLTRLFALTLFVHLANFAIALALLGIGFGATALHLRPSLVPANQLSSRLGWIAVLQGLALVAAVALMLNVPLTQQWDDSSDSIGGWNQRWASLLNEGNIAAIMPALMLPFCLGGLGFSAIFQHARDRIGKLYAADLWGGAAGGALFIPLLGLLAGPDTVFASVAACGVTGVLSFRAVRSPRGVAAAAVLLVLSLGALGVALTGKNLLRVKYTCGFAERDTTVVEWTPVARLSVHINKRKDKHTLVLDTSSGSEIVRTEERRLAMTRSPARSLVFRLVDPRQPVAVIASSAGNTVAVAQHFGFRDITAIDIAGGLFEIIRERYADFPKNPYLQPGVRELEMDGRAGILHSGRKYGVIEMRWANLNNAAGVISNAWSPTLLETREAFALYLRHLRRHGIIQFSKGPETRYMLPSALAALSDVGARRPNRHVAIVTGPDKNTALLIRREPFSSEEAAHLRDVVRSTGGHLLVDPRRPISDRMLRGARVLTDDRPYLDTWADMVGGLDRLFGGDGGGGAHARVNMMLWLQVLALTIAGVLFVGVPLLSRGRRDLAHLQGRSRALLYAAAIGYAYLAIETVLIHDLVIFVGHPTYAITLVILVMLLGSGIGSTRVGGLPAEGLERRLRVALVLAVAFALLQALVMPRLYTSVLVGAPLALRLAVVGVSLLPLGYFMGMPFPLAMRVLPVSAGEIVPWMWAVNGWMSVVATMATVFISRQLGFVAAFATAIAFYAVALAVAGGLPHVRARSAAPADSPGPVAAAP